MRKLRERWSGAKLLLWAIGISAIFLPKAEALYPVGEIVEKEAGKGNEYTFQLPGDGKQGSGSKLPQRAYWKTCFYDELTKSDSDNAFLEDLMRVQRLLQQPDKFYARLKELNKLVARIKKTERGYSDCQALEHALTDIEARHLFPAARLVPIGILEPEVFMSLPVRGFIPADVGAGLFHGELVHRLQWAAIMLEFESNPEEWAYTPLELYVKIGKFDEKHGKSEAAKEKPGAAGANSSATQTFTMPNLWSHLFDQMGVWMKYTGNHTYEWCNNKEEMIPDGYRHPDRLTKEFGRENGKSLPKGMELVAAGVSERYRQRVVAVNVQVKILGLDYSKIDELTPLQDCAWTELSKSLQKEFELEGSILVHKEDLDDFKKETEETTEMRIALSRLKWKNDSTSVVLKSLEKKGKEKSDYPSDLSTTISKIRQRSGKYVRESIVGSRKAFFTLPLPSREELVEMRKLGDEPLPLKPVSRE